jgi:hypothetical protein
MKSATSTPEPERYFYKCLNCGSQTDAMAAKIATADMVKCRACGTYMVRTVAANNPPGPDSCLIFEGTHNPDGTFTPAKSPEFDVSPDDADSARKMMERYGMSADEAAVSVDRQKVYGDPWVNHLGIAQGIAGILQPWAARIARMDPLPPHVVANILSALKLNRQRMRFHDDNFVDLAVYQRFARAWQREWEEAGEEKPIVIPPKPHPQARLVVRWEIPADAVR